MLLEVAIPSLAYELTLLLIEAGEPGLADQVATPGNCRALSLR